MLIVTLVYVLPVLWVVNTSFRFDFDTLSYPPRLFSKLTLTNYQTAFRDHDVQVNLKNSIIISISASSLALFLGVPCAYALSRFKFRGNSTIYLGLMSILIAPIMLTLIPVFIWSRQLGVFDRVWLLVLMNTMTNTIWTVWMMRTFFDEVSSEIDEAALVDGCNRFSCLVFIILPLSKPGLAATLIFCLIATWNDYFVALILSNVRAATLPMMLNTFISIYGLRWGEMCAAATLIMLPVLIFVSFQQKHLIKGLTMGAVKG